MKNKNWNDEIKIKESNLLYERLVHKFTGKKIINEGIGLAVLKKSLESAGAAKKSAKTLAAELAALDDVSPEIKAYLNGIQAMEETAAAAKMALFKEASLIAVTKPEAVQLRWAKNLTKDPNVNPLTQLKDAQRAFDPQSPTPTPAPTTTPTPPSAPLISPKITSAAADAGAKGVRGLGDLFDFSATGFWRNTWAGRGIMLTLAGLVGRTGYDHIFNNAKKDYVNNKCAGVLKVTSIEMQDTDDKFKECVINVAAIQTMALNGDSDSAKIIASLRSLLSDNKPRLKYLNIEAGAKPVAPPSTNQTSKDDSASGEESTPKGKQKGKQIGKPKPVGADGTPVTAGI